MARIAVIDDDAEVRDFIAIVATSAGHEVCTGPDGRAVRAILDSQPTDLLILDILMPNRDGLETILELRGSGHDLPILAISAGGRMDPGYLLRTARTFGADDILTKPFSREDLLDRISSILAAPSADRRTASPGHRARQDSGS